MLEKREIIAEFYFIALSGLLSPLVEIKGNSSIAINYRKIVFEL